MKKQNQSTRKISNKSISNKSISNKSRKISNKSISNKSRKVSNKNISKRKISKKSRKVSKRKVKINQKGGTVKQPRLIAHIKQKKPQKSNTNTRTARDKTKCAPDNTDNDFSCFSRPALIRMVESWNKSCQPEQKIQYKPSLKLSEIWELINQKLKPKCDTEWCWIDQDFTREEKQDLKKLFRPKMPSKWHKHPREWLTTTDIENVMKQYEKKHKEFKFIGPVPIDFDHEFSPGNCVANELCKIDVKNLINNNKHKLGVIFNLDPHDEPGSHWVAMYADIKQGGVYYFDSYGVEPPQEVTKLMNRLSQQGKSINNNIRVKVNKVRHQFKNSECGVYSINFIVNLLKGKSYEDLTNNVVKDDDMLKNRDVYYVRY